MRKLLDDLYALQRNYEPNTDIALALDRIRVQFMLRNPNCLDESGSVDDESKTNDYDEKLDRKFVDSIEGLVAETVRPYLKVPLGEDGPYCVYCARYGKDCEYARPGESSVAHLCIYYAKGSHKKVSPDDVPSPEYMAEITGSQGVAPMLKPVMDKMVHMNECLEKVLRLLAEKSSVEASAKFADECVTDALRQEIKDLEAEIDDYGEKIRMAKHQHHQLSALLKVTK